MEPRFSYRSATYDDCTAIDTFALEMFNKEQDNVVLDNLRHKIRTGYYYCENNSYLILAMDKSSIVGVSAWSTAYSEHADKLRDLLMNDKSKFDRTIQLDGVIVDKQYKDYKITNKMISYMELVLSQECKNIVTFAPVVYLDHIHDLIASGFNIEVQDFSEEISKYIMLKTLP